MHYTWDSICTITIKIITNINFLVGVQPLLLRTREIRALNRRERKGHHDGNDANGGAIS
jgi:hypothetical protein